MSSEKPPIAPGRSNDEPPEDLADEMLVAYLDGELSREEVTVVESNLHLNPLLRKRLDELRMAWDLLEELPDPPQNPKFTQSTIEMVAIAAQSPSVEMRSRARRLRMLAMIAASAAALLFLGFLLVRSKQWADERQTLAILPVIADWESLKKAIEAKSDSESPADSFTDSFKWLEMLLEVEGLDKVVSRPDSHGLGKGIVPSDIQERRNWIVGLDSVGRDRLSANLDSFKQQTRFEVQRSAVGLADKIYTSDRCEALLEAARNYAVFLSEISSRERDQLQDLAPKERQEDLRKRVNRKLVEVYCQSLPEQDRDVVANWIREMDEKYAGLLRSFAGRSGVALDLSRRLFSGPSEISDEDLQNLYESLSEEARAVLGRLDENERQTWLIRSFVGTVEPLPGRSNRRDIDRQAIEAAYQRRSEAEKSSLEYRTPQVVQEELGRRNAFGTNRSPRRETGEAREPSGAP